MRKGKEVIGFIRTFEEELWDHRGTTVGAPRDHRGTIDPSLAELAALAQLRA